MNTMLSSNAPVFTPATTQSPSVGTGGARQIPLTCTGHTRPVVDLSFSAYVPTTREYYLISACKDGIPILRKGSTGDWIGSFQGHKGAVWSARLSLDATLSVTGSADFSAKLWANNRGDALLTYPHRHVVRTVDISSDNRYILTGGLEKKVRIFDLQSQATDTPLRCLEGNENEVKTALLDGVNGIVFNGDGKTLRVWDLRSSAQVSARAFDDEITQLRFDWDRKYIICTAGKAVYFYNAVTAQLEKTIDVSVEVSSASLHPSNNRVVVGGSKDLWVRTYDFHTGKELEVYKGHHGPIHCISYSPDGHLYATGSEDGTVRLWQTVPGISYGLWQSQY